MGALVYKQLHGEKLPECFQVGKCEIAQPRLKVYSNTWLDEN